MIRAAGFQDADDIFDLIKQYPEELLPRPIGDIVQNVDRSFVCVMGNRVVGTVSWQILPQISAALDPSVEIKSLAVDKALRRKGIGRVLVEAAIEKIKSLRPAEILALTFTPEFFARFGFKETPKEKLMHKIYMGCINCAKYESPFTCPEVAMVLALRKPRTAKAK